ncbi:MAG: SDR family oxidoreductase [Mariprofundus sp.]
MNTLPEKILILGCGYVGERLATACMTQGFEVIGTTRNTQRAEELTALGIRAVVVDSPAALTDDLLASVNIVLDSIPLIRDASGMHAGQLQWLPELAPKLGHIRWAGYLSTTGVYGDARGDRVDESFFCKPESPRGSERLLAEAAWLQSGLPAEVFRLAGIYGPGRNILKRLHAGGYRAVQWQPPHYSSRIHVDDIVAALMAAMRRPRCGRIVNLADDMPLPHAEYVCAVARMIGAPQPEILSEAEGEAQLPESVLQFFRDNKRVDNQRLHRELLPQLHYPDFRAGLQALISQDKQGQPIYQQSHGKP